MRNKIGTLLFKKIFLWYLFIAITLTIFQVYSQYDKHDTDLNKELNITKKSYSKMLASAVWNLDEEHIKSNLSALISYDYISGVSIIDPHNYVIAQAGIVSTNEKKYINYIYKKEKIKYQSHLTASSYTLINKKFSPEILATVTLYKSHNHVLNHLENNIVLIIINSLIKSLLLLFLFLYFSNKIISQPLNQLITLLNKTNLSNNEKITLDSIDVAKDNELTALVDSYNNMQERIHQEIEKNKHQDLLLQQQSKLASMGEMIGNIAHQWRQPLSVISASASGVKLLDDLGTPDPKFMTKSIDRILNSTQYLSKTIDDFNSFLHKDNKIKKFNLNELIEKVILTQTVILEENQIKRIKNIDENIHLVNYSEALFQVLINIINNAHDILKEKDFQRYIFIDSCIKNNKVILKIKDNGGGIPKEIIDKVFEAYFTTKHQERGTGLGLHMTYNLIILNMKGLIEVQNSTYAYEGNHYTGAEFIITLPIS